MIVTGEFSSFCMLLQQAMPKHSNSLTKSRLAVPTFLLRSSANLLLNSLFQFQIQRIYYFLRSREFCADMRFRFFFLVSCDQSLQTKGDSQDYQSFIYTGVDSSSLGLQAWVGFLDLACSRFNVNLCFLMAVRSYLCFSLGMVLYCSMQPTMSPSEAVLRHMQLDTSHTSCWISQPSNYS